MMTMSVLVLQAPLCSVASRLFSSRS